MAVRLLAGFSRYAEPYAVNDFLTLPVGPVVDLTASEEVVAPLSFNDVIIVPRR